MLWQYPLPGDKGVVVSLVLEDMGCDKPGLVGEQVGAVDLELNSETPAIGMSKQQASPWPITKQIVGLSAQQDDLS